MTSRRADTQEHGFIALVGALTLLCAFAAQSAHGQVRAGAAYLKIQPSIRYQGMAGALSAAIDEVQAFYANPASTAFSREWQWSAAYTRWIADIYGVAANYGRQFRTPWSRRFNVALGLNYQGVREFDSTQGRRPPVSAGDLVGAISVGSPLTILSANLAVGGNLKYLHSDLSGNTASAYIVDMGVMYRSPRISIGGPFQYGLLSAGFAVDHMGSPLQFFQEKTPLPRTLRGGVAMHLGSHNGLQLQLSGDYYQVRDEIGRFCVGAEIAWGYRLALRTGYEFNDRLLSKLSMGMSLRLDDQTSVAREVILGSNQALRVDIGGLEANELFQMAGRAGAHHYTIGPERFDLLQPLPHDTVRSQVVTLRWQASRDPDLFDDVRYVLLVEHTTGVPAEPSQLARLLDLLAQRHVRLRDAVKSFGSSFYAVCDSTFGVTAWPEQAWYPVANLPAGDYLWTVIAYDRDEHLRVASQKIWPCHVTRPDIQVVDIVFEPDVWITESDTQGVVSVQVRNNGPWPAERMEMTVVDEPPGPGGSFLEPDTVWRGEIVHLPPRNSRAVSFLWRTRTPGLHRFTAHALLCDAEGKRVLERDLADNVLSRTFYTIPKGVVAIPDTVQAFVLPLIAWEVPLLTKVFFDAQSAEVAPQYYKPSQWFYAPLDTLARRVAARQEVVLTLEGFADVVNGEPVTLARTRAMAVRTVLLELGVPPEQVPMDSVKWGASPDRKVTPNVGAHQERRNVRIRAVRRSDGTPQVDIIAPVPLRNVPQPPVPLPVSFSNTVKGVVPVQSGWLHLQATELNDSLAAGYALRACDSLLWPLGEEDVGLLHKGLAYSLVMRDTLGRRFRTRERQGVLVPRGCELPIVVGLAEFNDPKPFAIVWWERVFHELATRLRYSPNMRYRFVGHACGITPRLVNNAFSRLRAAHLQEEFIRAVQGFAETEPANHRLVLSRLDRDGALGKGADEPFSISLSEEEFLKSYREIAPGLFEKISLLHGRATADCQPFLFRAREGELLFEGDNATPLGRQINRRIQIEFFSK
ncbi:MAG: PorV/PorQ family protein [bacterium]|jgi:outer membrane protein OmpA-like peptidoglycan-associated protein|nr:PorV/PorQ family protein [candidate division KSB1 bacterium]MDH7561722.1 PorV/PorQ family protein [bacterium]